MDDALLMCRFESFSDLETEFEGFLDWNSPVLQAVRQRVAL